MMVIIWETVSRSQDIFVELGVVIMLLIGNPFNVAAFAYAQVMNKWNKSTYTELHYARRSTCIVAARLRDIDLLKYNEMPIWQ